MGLGKPLNTIEGMKEALMWYQGVIPGTIKKQEVWDFAWSQVPIKNKLQINQSR